MRRRPWLSQVRERHNRPTVRKVPTDQISRQMTKVPNTSSSFVQVEREGLVKKIKEAGGFSILLDKTIDVSGVEQLFICVRYVSTRNSKPTLHEDFLTFAPVHDQSAESLAKLILEQCAKLGLDMNNCVGQGYDRAANMADHINGVQTRIRMNQKCKVCGEPAAGFHFGAFTCEGCKSFFGRSYNNISTIGDCKNNGECIINKKNRTTCKACRLRKCLVVGMSKSGSRYGRRSNWFKIHCLLQEQQQQQQQQNQQNHLPNSLLQQQSLSTNPLSTRKPPMRTPPHNNNNNQQNIGLGLLGPQPFPPPLLHLPRTREELVLLGFEDYRQSASPSVSSPESHNSDSSLEVNDVRRSLPLFPGLLPPSFLPPPNFLFPPGYPTFYPGLLQPAPADNNNRPIRNNNHTPTTDAFNKRVILDAVLRSQRSPTPEEPETAVPSDSPVQEDPLDLSMKPLSERGSSPAHSDRSGSERTERGAGSEADESDCDSETEMQRIKRLRPTPLDLTTKM
ncbi:hypothetical protein ILUMI_12206 [Ignelater luminosus]|uniref:Nuclear receptor domain-containing protein n=1 Tax=Ignelater luminosus TaxID=2038154 RepID=A0A8K0G9S1_IGNLU|nr:hypothetical protein ILUMI_12206 [Ignelater luminosus]